ENFVFASCLQGDEQPIWEFFLGHLEERAIFSLPTHHRLIEQEADHKLTIVLSWRRDSKVRWTDELAIEQYHLIHPVESKVANVVAQVAIGDQHPIAKSVNQGVWIGLACLNVVVLVG